MSATIPSLMQAPRAFGYCRKSTNEQREESLEAQQRAIVTFAATAGYELVQVYKDHGNSGRRGERPEFQRMLADAAVAGVQYIIVHKLDRFSVTRISRRWSKCSCAGRAFRSFRGGTL